MTDFEDYLFYTHLGFKCHYLVIFFKPMNSGIILSFIGLQYPIIGLTSIAFVPRTKQMSSTFYPKSPIVSSLAVFYTGPGLH